VPQFRTLIFLNRHEGTSLSEVAEHIGLTLPSMSKMVDGLVIRGLTTRETHREDRRRMTLTLTRRGRTTLSSAYETTEAYLGQLFATLSSTERATIIQGMQLLRQLFAGKRGAAAGKEVLR